MGVNLRDLFERKPIDLESLAGKRLVIDGYNILYQFLTTIRAPDGSLFTNKKGRVTSHLIGLFSRTTHFLDKGLLPMFVFDGEVPKLKKKEIERRAEIKRAAKKLYEHAKKEEDITSMYKYAARTAILTRPMVDDAKELLSLLGIPVVQAPSEGEAQASFMVKQGDAWAVISQDFDSLLYGTPRLIQNLSIVGRRKKAGTLAYENITPLFIELQSNLKKLGINQDQLIVLAILVGTDYHPGGIKGIGPKNALKLVKEYKHDFSSLFKFVNWDEHCSVDWKEIYDLFKNMPVIKDYDTTFKLINKEEIYNFLIEKNDFSQDRVTKAIESLIKKQEKRTQKSLGDF